MKRRYIINLLIIFIALFGCTKKSENTLNTTVSPVAGFFAPADSAFYDLGTTSTIVFEWGQAQPQDGTLTLYTIVFDKPSGDFSNPVYEVASDGNGIFNRASLSRDVLNKVCRLAGLQPSQSGTLKWAVYAYKAANKVVSAKTRLITLKRPFGLDNPPVNVYLTGSATEGGTDLTKALKLKLVNPGIYEIYTSLKPGTYQFTDNTSGSVINYYYNSNDTIREGNTVTTVTGTDTKVYRLRLDFNLLTVTRTAIKEVGLWFAPDNNILFTLNYDKNGTWRTTNQLITFHQESWGRDERYKFRFLVNNGTADSYEFWGSVNSDNSRPTTSTNLSFWYMYPVNSAQYDYCFKFITQADGAHCDVNVYMSPDRTNYTHEVIPH